MIRNKILVGLTAVVAALRSPLPRWPRRSSFRPRSRRSRSSPDPTPTLHADPVHLAGPPRDPEQPALAESHRQLQGRPGQPRLHYASCAVVADNVTQYRERHDQLPVPAEDLQAAHGRLVEQPVRHAHAVQRHGGRARSAPNVITHLKFAFKNKSVAQIKKELGHDHRGPNARPTSARSPRPSGTMLSPLASMPPVDPFGDRLHPARARRSSCSWPSCCPSSPSAPARA